MNKLYDLRINHMQNPFGIDKEITFSFKTTFGQEFKVVVMDEDENEVYSEKVSLEDINCIKLKTTFRAGKAYTWKVICEDIESEVANFEIADILENRFITTASDIVCPKFVKEFEVGKIKKAKLYITGLGLYRAFLNGKRIGDDYLTPFFNDYDAYLRYQSYDITDLVESNNQLEVVVGDGWYKGRFGIEGHGNFTFGDNYLLNAKIVLELLDGTKNIITTDESWLVTNSQITDTSIYDGESRNDNLEFAQLEPCKVFESRHNLIPDFSQKVKKKLEIKPNLIISHIGEQILDFGQNMVGFAKFICREAKDTKIQLQYGEVLQDDCFYNGNLRTAKAEFNYIANGEVREIEPYFTFYGFRYVKVTGIEKVNPNDFTGVVLYTDLESTLEVKSSNSKINQLMQNVLWGQRGNFLDVPTDCPQRDERLGWTADTQVFVNTACYNMDTFGFYRKFMRDLRADQTMYYEGDIPMYSPSLKKSAGNGGAVWADAGTIVPWNVYMAYGDKVLLCENYDMMKDYIETVIKADVDAGNRHIITWGFTFGDWLAQDGVCETSMKGGTDDTFIKTVYYRNSLELVANAAEVLGKEEDVQKYKTLGEEVKAAIIDEYFSKNGRLALTTQTSYILALYYGIYIDKAKLVEEFRDRLNKDFYKMRSGFTGTPLILSVLFENGMVEEAYKILFNEECPGWLYQINLGATTIWERWNSLLPDGKISGIQMNSLNHYALGSVCEAIYAHIGGLKNAKPGWKKAIIAPKPNYRLKYFDIAYNSQVGEYKVNWKIEEDGTLDIKVKVPYGASAEIVLPSHPESRTEVVSGGVYGYRYTPTQDYIHPYSINSYALELMENEEARNIIKEKLPRVYGIIAGEGQEFLLSKFKFFGYLSMFGTNPEEVREVAKLFENIRV